MPETILLVDDDAKVRESIRGVLGDEGYEVVTASNGVQAMDAVAVHNPDLILLDLWMPEMDGIEFLQQAGSGDSAIPVIVISGHGNVETAVRATKLGAVDFVEKPFSIDGLLAAVNGALNRFSPDEGAASVVAGQLPSAGGATAGVSQRTLAQSVVGGGLGLHSGVRTGLILQPMPPGSGISFASIAGEGKVLAHVDNVDSTGYATTLFDKGTVARTVEHLMATLHAYGITNLLVKIEGEVPILDGSAAELCQLIDSVGVEDQPSAIAPIVIEEEVRIDAGPDEFIVIRPHDGFEVTYELSYPPPVGEQSYTFCFEGAGSFRSQIAPARTFGFVEEIRALEGAGLGQGGQLSNFILIGEGRIVNTELRFPEELARHKILDIMGDFYLLGAPIRGSLHARKTGHSQNIALMRLLSEGRGRSASSR